MPYIFPFTDMRVEFQASSMCCKSCHLQDPLGRCDTYTDIARHCKDCKNQKDGCIKDCPDYVGRCAG